MNMSYESDSSNDADFGEINIDRAYQPYQDEPLAITGVGTVENIGCETDIDGIVDVTERFDKIKKVQDW